MDPTPARLLVTVLLLALTATLPAACVRLVAGLSASDGAAPFADGNARDLGVAERRADGPVVTDDFADGSNDQAPPKDGLAVDGIKPPAEPGLCSADNVCWLSPLPQGNDLNGVWVGPNATFAVGSAGTILRRTSITAWTRMASPTTNPLQAVWGAPKGGLVYAIGDEGTVLVLTPGSAGWSPVAGAPAGLHRAIWGTAGALFIGGAGLYLYGPTSALWSTLAAPSTITGNVTGIWGSSASDVWAVTDQGTALHGGLVAKWSQNPTPASSLLGIWGTAANNLYAIGANTSLWRKTNDDWKALPIGNAVLTGTTLTGVWASSSKDLRLVTDEGQALTFDGASWTATAIPGRTLAAVAGAPIPGGTSRGIAVGAAGAILRWVGGAWAIEGGAQETPDFEALWGTAGTDLWATEGTKIWHFDGVSWSLVHTANAVVTAISGGPAAVWAATAAGRVLRYTTSTKAWQVVLQLPTTAILALHMVGTGIGYAGDQDGRVHLRAKTGLWLPMQVTPGGSAGIVSVWGRSTSEAWALDAGGRIFHFTGGAWLQEHIEAGLTRLGGTATEVFAAGTSGKVLRRAASGAWTNTKAPADVAIHDVIGVGSAIYLVGDRGLLLRWRPSVSAGGGWEALNSGTRRALRGVWGNAQGVYVVGDRGATLSLP